MNNEEDEIRIKKMLKRYSEIKKKIIREGNEFWAG